MFEIRLPERENFRKLAISRLTKKNIAHMNNITFKKDLLGVQDDLLRFAYKLTSDREEANDLYAGGGSLNLGRRRKARRR